MTELERVERDLAIALKEVVRLKERVAFLAYALAEVSAAPMYRVSEDQFSMLAREEVVQ